MHIIWNELVVNPLWFYLFIVNIYMFGIMWYDKRKAIKHQWRIPESNLLFMGIIGGGIGGLLARRIFRHKTKKPKFLTAFLVGTAVDALLIAFYH